MCSYWVIWFYTIFSISRVYMNDKLRIFSKLYCWCRQQNYTSINLEKSIRKSLLNMQFSYVFAMLLTFILRYFRYRKYLKWLFTFIGQVPLTLIEGLGVPLSLIYQISISFHIFKLPYFRVLDKLFLAHLSWKLKWAFLIVHLLVHLSICQYKCHIFIFFSRTTGPFSTKLDAKRHWVKGIHEGLPFSKGDYKEIEKIHWWNLKIFFSRTMCWTNFNQTWHKAFMG